MVNERNKYSPHLYLCRFILPLSLSCWFFYSLFLLPACSQRSGSCFDMNKRVPRTLTGSGLGPPRPPQACGRRVRGLGRGSLWLRRFPGCSLCQKASWGCCTASGPLPRCAWCQRMSPASLLAVVFGLSSGNVPAASSVLQLQASALSQGAGGTHPAPSEHRGAGTGV